MVEQRHNADWEVDGVESASAVVEADHAGDLAEMIRAYHAVTERLQQSHERLQSEVVRLQRELASTNAQLQRSKRLSALGEMAAGIAHEIRNPLAAIQLYAQLVGDELEGESSRENVRRIISAVQGLNGIVSDVLSFAREIEPSRSWLRVGTVLEGVSAAHRPAVEEAGVELVLPEGKAANLLMYADGNLVHQALLNLLRNAVEAVRGCDRRLVLLEAWPEASGVGLGVRDSGPGVARSDVDRIFNPFFTTRDTGTGLGLAIVHRIVDAHGGTITADNGAEGEAAGGAVFALSLPYPEASGAEGASDER